MQPISPNNPISKEEALRRGRLMRSQQFHKLFRQLFAWPFNFLNRSRSSAKGVSSEFFVIDKAETN